MDQISRRRFLQTTSASIAGVSIAGAALWSAAPDLMANPLGLPIGLQLYSVRDVLPKHYEGTLKQLGALGYQEVEAAGFFGRSAADVKQAMAQANLTCVSSHHSMPDLLPRTDAIIEYGNNLGLKYIICSSPALQDPSHAKPHNPHNNMEAMTLDDWKWNIEQFNRIGEKVNAAGMRFGYHNHTAEFRPQNGVLPYDEILRLTDPAKVTLEMDCGWVVVGGKDPAEYLTRYPTRISMLHVKDFKLTGKPASESAPPPSAELGRGSIDYRRIFEAAKNGHIEHAFIEQEYFDIPEMEALKIDADYMRALTV